MLKTLNYKNDSQNESLKAGNLNGQIRSVSGKTTDKKHIFYQLMLKTENDIVNKLSHVMQKGGLK